MTPQQINQLEGILSYDRSLHERGKERLSETALAVLVHLTAATPIPSLGVHRSYARLGEEIGSRSANGKPMKAKAIANAVREIDAHGLFERRRDNPRTHASDGPGSIHEFRLVELTEITKPASVKAVEAILNAVPVARKVGPVNFAVGCRLLYAADATLAASGLTQQELAKLAGVVRETAFKALDVLQANGLFVVSWGKSSERLNRETRRKQAEFSVQLAAGERVEAAAPAPAVDDEVIEIAPVEERKATRRRSTAEVEAELEQLLASSRNRGSIEKALQLIEQRAKKRLNGEWQPVKLPASQKLSFTREILERENGPHAAKLARALEQTNRSLFRQNGTAFEKRYLPYLDVVLAGDAPALKASATPGKALESEIRATLLRCSELNGAGDQLAARELFKQQVWPRREEVAKQLFAGDRKLATASLREAFKRGDDWFVGIEPLLVYGLNYDKSFNWHEYLGAAAEVKAAAV